MKKILAVALSLSFCMGMMAEDVESIKKQINSIKKDNEYIYADITASTAEEAEDIAEEALYDKINEWAAHQKVLGKKIVVTDSSEDHWKSVAMPRGNMFRSFIYVKKADLLSGVEPSALSAAPEKDEKEDVSSSEVQVPAVVMDVALCTEYDDLAAKITRLKAEGKISKYGRYASLDNPQDYYLAVYNREGKIVAVLSAGSSRINVWTKQADSEKNYKGCGAIGFKINN